MKRLLIISVCCVWSVLCFSQVQNIRLGIIGLDTSHSSAFTTLINGDTGGIAFAGFEVVAAYPYGSKTIASSYERIPKVQQEVEEYGVSIVSSISDLLAQVDAVLLETNDGNLHLEQALQVFKAGKPVFIDKPIGATLAQTLAIVKLAQRYQIPLFSSSALRFSQKTMELRNGKHGKVLGADCYSPASNEASHADLFWYGIHGVETLFTVMGSGCETVSALSTNDADLAIAIWKDGRMGSFRGMRQGKSAYGGTVWCEKQVVQAGGYEGYAVLLENILRFFRTQQSPVAIEETLEIYTFMEAFNESKRQGGKPVSLQAVYEQAAKEADLIIAEIVP